MRDANGAPTAENILGFLTTQLHVAEKTFSLNESAVDQVQITRKTVSFNLPLNETGAMQRGRQLHEQILRDVQAQERALHQFSKVPGHIHDPVPDSVSDTLVQYIWCPKCEAKVRFPKFSSIHPELPHVGECYCGAQMPLVVR